MKFGIKLALFGSLIMGAFSMAAAAVFYIPVISHMLIGMGLILALSVGHWYHLLKLVEREK